MHKHDPKPPKRHSSLDDQEIDDPLDATTMPHATRPGPPDKARHVPKMHGATHEPIKDDRKCAAAGHGRTHLPAKEKKGGAGSWVGPERVGERETEDEFRTIPPLEED